MESTQFSYSYNTQQNIQPYLIKEEYIPLQSDFYQNEQNNIITQEAYQTNDADYTKLVDNNIYNQYFTQNYDINTLYPENINQMNIIPQTNKEEQKNQIEEYNLNITNSFTSNNVVNTNYQINNNIEYNNNLNINTNINNTCEKTNLYINEENKNINHIENNNTNNYENNIILNNENPINELKSEIENKQINFSITNNQNKPNNETENNQNKNDISDKGSEPLDENQEIQDKASSIQNPSEMNNQSNIKLEKRKLSSLKIINPLESNIINSPIVHSINNKEESEYENDIKNKQEGKKESNIDFLKEENYFLRNKEEYKKKEFDFKTHFNLNFTKEKEGFFYNKVHKIITPLLGHYEMPEDLEYKYPLLSPDEKYLACIGKGDIDWVFVWEMSNLYWYKYKFCYSKVDCITFTPNSKSLIIVYKYSNPIMYDLSTGKMSLKLVKNGEEKNRESYQCSFTTIGTHFALTSTKSYTLWSLKSGKILQRIKDNSPVKIICREYLINIDSKLNCVIRNIWEQNIIENFQIKGISTPQEILDARLSKDMTNFIYVIKPGIVIYNFKEKEYTGLQKFDSGVESASFNDDAKLIMKTNMRNLCINDLEKGTNICTILKAKFNDYKIDFTLKKLITIDNISITIQDIFDEQPIEKHVWLNKNPTKFIDVQFSRNFDFLLARISSTEIVIYNLKCGYIIKKFETFDEKWLDYTMTNNGGDRIAVKLNKHLIKIWNFITQKEEATFYNYNSNSLCFSADGYYLTSGIKKGSEVARIWDISEQKYGSYLFNGINDNLNTKVHLTFPTPKRLICCSVNQQPLIFNSYSKELLYKCECPIKFEHIYDIESDLRFDIFIIKGRDYEKRNMAIRYKISDGSLIQIYENYTMLELTKYKGFLLIKCDNINQGKLSSIDLKNKNEEKMFEFQLQTNRCELINDNKTAIIKYGDKYCKEFNLINIYNGNFIGKINYVQNLERNSETYLTADCDKNELFFRYFEFLSPEETIAYLKKNFCIVEGKNSQ